MAALASGFDSSTYSFLLELRLMDGDSEGTSDGFDDPLGTSLGSAEGKLDLLG